MIWQESPRMRLHEANLGVIKMLCGQSCSCSCSATGFSPPTDLASDHSMFPVGSLGKVMTTAGKAMQYQGRMGQDLSLQYQP